MQIKGTFDVKLTPEPPIASEEGITLSRIVIAKEFQGDLAATSAGHMIAARTPIEDSAGYVAIERVTGSLAGRRGSFVLQHHGVMTRGKRELRVIVVPDSGTGELRGIHGNLAIDIVDGKHFYTFDYDFDA